MAQYRLVEARRDDGRRTFSHLGEAVQLIATALETADAATLGQACRDPLPAAWVLDRLRDQNARTPLVALYAGREFPADGTDFKLGGHNRELGHIHIDFVRGDDGWELGRIWLCR